jgi:threonine-phosphate decarboxylase
MYEYVHGGDIYSEKLQGRKILDFSVNTNPLGLPLEVKQAIAGALEDYEKYPDPFCRELTAALANYEQTDPHYIFCANGASDIIFRLALALEPRRALLCAPTFADYEKALLTVGCKIDYYALAEEKEFSVGTDFLANIQAETDIVILCNPNNPTGQLLFPFLIKELLDHCRKTNTVVMVDECFMDFVDQPEYYSHSHMWSPLRI